MDLNKLYNSIPLGKVNSKPIWVIAFGWGISKRKAQEFVNEKMSESDLIVCRTAKGNYFRPKTYEELNEYYERHHRHTKKCENQDYRINKALENWARYPNVLK